MCRGLIHGAQTNDGDLAIRLGPIAHVLRRVDGNPLPCRLEVRPLWRFRSDADPPSITELDDGVRVMGQVVQPLWMATCAAHRGDREPGTVLLLDQPDYG